MVWETDRRWKLEGCDQRDLRSLQLVLLRGEMGLGSADIYQQREQRGLQLVLMRGEKGQISAELCYQRVQRSLQL